MNINNKCSFITILIFTILFVKLNYAFNEKSLKNQRLLVRCKKKCQNNDRKLKEFCKKCPSLEILDKNEMPENNKNSKNKIPRNRKINDNKNSSIILLSNSTIFDYNKIENLIVFGDSHSSVGTNFKDMSYTGKNCSGGKNWPLQLIQFNNMKLWDFAIGASVINKNVANENKTLIQQYEYFYESMSEGKKLYNIWNKNNSLFAIWIGINDVTHSYSRKVPVNADETTTILFDIIKKMYDVGARNILLFTIFRISYLVDKKHFKDEILGINSNIIKKSKLFFEKYPDTNIIVYNTIDKFDDIFSNCNKYKLKDCTNYWMNNKKDKISDYLWVNIHMTEAGNEIFAKDIHNLLNSINN